MNIREFEGMRLSSHLARARGYREFVFPLTLVSLVAFIAALPLVLWGFPLANHDGAIHLRWTHHATHAFQKGDVYPRYFPELNEGFGSPSFFYYPPLSTFVSALFAWIAPQQDRDLYALGWSAAFALILSGIAMWWFLYRCTNHRWAATVGASLYVIAPYHLGTDLFSRGANAEFWAFVFMPLVLFTFHRLSDAHQHDIAPDEALAKRTIKAMASAIAPSPSIVIAAVTLALFFLCHVLTAIAFAPVAFAYAIVLGRGTLKHALVAGVWAVLLAAVFLIPAAGYSKYIAGNANPSFMGEMLRTTFFFPLLNLSQPTLEKDMFHQHLTIAFLGQVAIWAVALVSLFSNNYDVKRRKLLIVLCFAAQLCISMMLPIAEPLYVVFPFLRRLQFAWRFLSPGTFICVALLGVLFPCAKNSRRELVSWTAAVLAFVFTAAFVNIPLFRMHLSKEHRSSIAVLDVNLRAIDGFGEYVPAGADLRKAHNFFSNTNAKPWDWRRIAGAGDIAVRESGSRRVLLLSDLNEPSTFVFHQFWFSGWRANISGDGQALPLVGHTGTGLLQLTLPQGVSAIELRLTRLLPEQIGIVTSVLAFTWLLLLVVARVFRRRLHPSRAQR
jgi:hypothetical protein